MKEQASSCRDNPKHTYTQREGPTVREDHLHLWLDKERCRSTRWNALLPYRRIQQSMYMVCKHPTLIIIHDTPFMEVYSRSIIPGTRCSFNRSCVFVIEAHAVITNYDLFKEVRFFVANKRLQEQS